MAKLVNDNGDDWDLYLDRIAFAYRVNQQASTKKSPFELMYGVRARLPSALEEGTEETEKEFEWEPVDDVPVDAVVERAKILMNTLPRCVVKPRKILSKHREPRRSSTTLNTVRQTLPLEIRCSGITDVAIHARVEN